MKFLSFYFRISVRIKPTRGPSKVPGSSGDFRQKECSLTEAMRQYGIPRNTLRGYIGICELKVIDAERYKRVIEAERERVGKVSVKCIELSCRAVLNEYRVQANKLKQQKKLLPFYPKEDFYSQN